MPASPTAPADLETLCIQTIRTLSMDAVQAAKSGHPGTPVALAPVTYALWQRFLRYDPADPAWPNRDRFVLSAGHASMLLYAMLHLTGVRAIDERERPIDEAAVSLDEIRRFRQLDSKTPGHPEYHWTSGVETTTGPLGQGVGNSVGMAIAGLWLGARYNTPECPLFDFNVYAICGDGDLMEGVASEAASLAGHLRLENLCWIYDSNRISIEGSTDLAFTEDVPARFRAYGWHVLEVADANDLDAFARAVEAFQAETGRPTLIVVHSQIAHGTRLQGSHKTHGEPLGEAVIDEFKRTFGLSPEAFHVDPQVYDHFRSGIGERGRALRDDWFARFARYQAQHPDKADELERIWQRRLPDGWDRGLRPFPADPKGMATRVSSSKVLNLIAPDVPWLIGGSADLAPSTKTIIEAPDAGTFQASNRAGRNFHFGVREHAMGAILNGMSLVKVRPYGSGFLIFSDYMRGSIRLSALMELPVIDIFTHDSIGVGEDGPTHQPIEQLPSLRAIPGLLVIRPCDANEVVEAWRVILPLSREPAVLVLTRQDLPTLDRSRYAPASGLARGAYVLADPPQGRPEVLLIGTGSEVHPCLAAYEQLQAEGIPARVVSMPSWELFERQPQSYRHEVLPPSIKARVAVEQASMLGWERYVGAEGACLGMRSFGASAPAKALQAKFGFTPERVAAAAREQLARFASPATS